MKVGEISKGCNYIKNLNQAKKTINVSDNLPYDVKSLPESVVIEIQNAVRSVLDEKIAETEQRIKDLVNNNEVRP